MVNYYEELGINPDLSCEVVKDILDDLEVTWLGREKDDYKLANKKLSLIYGAKSVFNDENSRRIYDSKLKIDSVPSSNSIDDTVIVSTPKPTYNNNLPHTEYIEREHVKKSFFSAVCVGIAVATIIFWLVIIVSGFINDAYTTEEFQVQTMWIVLGVSFGFFFLLAGLPWGLSFFFNTPLVLALCVSGFFVQLILFLISFGFCFALGWIYMLINIPTIIHNLKKQ